MEDEGNLIEKSQNLDNEISSEEKADSNETQNSENNNKANENEEN